MSLKDEYNTDFTIDGKTYSLDFVRRETDPVTGETVISRRFVDGAGETKILVQRLPGKQAPAVAPAAKPTSVPGKKPSLVKRAAKRLKRAMGSAD